MLLTKIKLSAAELPLNISLAGDMVYDLGVNKESSATDKLTMRSAEMTFYAPVDHIFDATLSAAAHDESGETVFELHELTLSSNKLIPGVRAKVGQYFLGLGKLNPTHQHDWYFTKVPLVQKSFFADEGLLDSGAEFSSLLPLPFYLDLTIGVTSGHKYGHSHSAGSKPRSPTHYLRASFFKEFTRSSGLEYALNYLGRKDQNSTALTLIGLDFTLKSQTQKVLDYLIQSEIWFKNERPKSSSPNELLGGYFYFQKGINSNWATGIQSGALKNLSKRDAISKRKLNNISYEFAPNISFKASEFSTLRLSASHEFTREEGETTSKDTQVLMQFIFILGSHAAHNF